MSTTSFTRIRRNSLNVIAAKRIGFGCQGKVGTFIDNYIVCEATATKLVQFYKTDKKFKSSGPLRKDDIHDALVHFGIQINKLDVGAVFTGGSGKKGTKSARQLRNGFLHSISESDRIEIEAKYAYFMKLMSEFLSTD